MGEYLSGEDPRAKALPVKQTNKRAGNPWKWVAISAIGLLIIVSFFVIKHHGTPSGQGQGSNLPTTTNGNGPSVHNEGGPPPTDCSAANGCANSSQGNSAQNYQSN